MLPQAKRRAIGYKVARNVRAHYTYVGKNLPRVVLLVEI